MNELINQSRTAPSTSVKYLTRETRPPKVNVFLLMFVLSRSLASLHRALHAHLPPQPEGGPQWPAAARGAQLLQESQGVRQGVYQGHQPSDHRQSQAQSKAVGTNNEVLQLEFASDLLEIQATFSSHLGKPANYTVM